MHDETRHCIVTEITALSHSPKKLANHARIELDSMSDRVTISRPVVSVSGGGHLSWPFASPMVDGHGVQYLLFNLAPLLSR